jgi:hypothetical protein
MEDRRRSSRHKTLKGARIVFNNGSSSLSCIVRDLSDGGAKLELESSLGVPASFSVYLNLGGDPIECAVTWRHEKAIGVRFVNSPAGSGKID